MKRPLTIQILSLALALSAVACGAESKETQAKSAPAAAWDTGSYSAEEDAWQTQSEAGADEYAHSWDGESGAYDGLRPTHPEVLSDPEDEGYASEGMLYVEFDLENIGELDFDREPGLVLSVNHDDIQLAEPAKWVPDLAAGERTRMQWWAAVGPMVHPGSTLTFTATASARECEGDSCPVPHTASVFITLE